MLPVIGTETTLQGAWLKAVSGAIGSANLKKYVVGMQPYAPATGPSWAVYNKALLASTGCPIRLNGPRIRTP